MYVQAMVNECDFTGNKYDSPRNGAWAVAQGATGRWCVVMYAGPEFIAENGIKPVAIEDAYRAVEEQGNGYADF